MVLSWSHQIQFGTHGFCSFSLPQHKPTPGPNRVTELSCRRWKHITILRMVIIDIIVIIVIIVYVSVLLRLLRLLSLWRLWKLFRLLTLLHFFRLVGINWFASCIRARPRKSDSVRNSDSEYPASGKTAGCTSWWHRDNPTPPAPPPSGGAWRPQAGFRRWMPYVVFQYVGIGMVPWYVMKLGGLSARLSCNMEKGSMWTRLQSTIFGALSSPLWWVKANSIWFFQQCSVLSRSLPSMRVS